MDEQRTLPLAGKRVVVTRPLKTSAGLMEELRSAGATAILFPLIWIEPPQDLMAFDAALRDLSNYDWLIFTSRNAVPAVSRRLAGLPEPSRSVPASVRVAAVGAATGEAAREAGFRDAFAGRGTATDLIAELAGELRGKKVFLPRSDKAAPELLDQLRAAGAEVREVIAYRTVAVEYRVEDIEDDIKTADAFLFFSPSAVQAFRRLLESGVLSSRAASAAFGAIGPVTANALERAGLRCDFRAARPGNAAIVAALAAHFQGSKNLTVPRAVSP